MAHFLFDTKELQVNMDKMGSDPKGGMGINPEDMVCPRKSNITLSNFIFIYDKRYRNVYIGHKQRK